MRTRVVALALTVALLSAGCAQHTAGQVAMTTEPMPADMSCQDYTLLSDSDRVKFTADVLGTSSSAQPVLLSSLALILCNHAPQTPVKEILLALRR